MSDGLSVQQVAREAGVASSTVRLYARRGLLVTNRTPGNARRFGYDAPCRIVIVKAAQRVGLDLDAIAALLHALPADADPDDWERLTRQIVEAAERRIAQLRQVIAEVTTTAPLSTRPFSPTEVRSRQRPEVMPAASSRS